jgi:hypothetical protein
LTLSINCAFGTSVNGIIHAYRTLQTVGRVDHVQRIAALLMLHYGQIEPLPVSENKPHYRNRPRLYIWLMSIFSR